MAVFCELAPAKVNLTLEVLGKRPDGYHELKSLVAFAREAVDVVTLDTSKPLRVTVSGPFGGTIAGANLIETTLNVIAREAPELSLGAVHLEKNLPVAAGIGGGSADAAAVIRAVRAANPEIDANGRIDWKSLAASLGADVPVCLAARSVLMSGVGEILEPVVVPSLAAVLVNPLVPVPVDKTAQVFRNLGAAPVREVKPLQAPALGNVAALLDYLRAHGNDLEAAAAKIVPELSAVKNALSAAHGALISRMSGGGPTCFAVFAETEAAASAAKSIATERPTWWVCAVTLS